MPEQSPTAEFFDQFGMEDFDINAAFQGAVADVVTNQELALDEKVRRMESIVAEGSSELYRDFVDFSQLAQQMEMLCAHDHDLQSAFESSSSLSSLMNRNEQKHGHDHDEKDAKKSKKKKTKLSPSLFSLLLDYKN